MKYLGKMLIGNNQAGKGDGVRPRAKLFKDELFKDTEAVKFWEDQHDHKAHCMLCGQRIYSSTFLSNKDGKTIQVGSCCLRKVYL